MPPVPSKTSSHNGTDMLTLRGSDHVETPATISLDETTNPPSTSTNSDVRRSSRDCQPSVLLHDFVCHTTRRLDPPLSVTSAVSIFR